MDAQPYGVPAQYVRAAPREWGPYDLYSRPDGITLLVLRINPLWPQEVQITMTAFAQIQIRGYCECGGYLANHPSLQQPEWRHLDPDCQYAPGQIIGLLVRHGVLTWPKGGNTDRGATNN